jgi:hypothetical protein
MSLISAFTYLLTKIDVSIYIKKNVCLSGRYAFSSCNSYDHQTFHDTSLGPREAQRGVDMVIGGGGPGWNFTQMVLWKLRLPKCPWHLRCTEKSRKGIEDGRCLKFNLISTNSFDRSLKYPSTTTFSHWCDYVTQKWQRVRSKILTPHHIRWIIVLYRECICVFAIDKTLTWSPRLFMPKLKWG